MKSVWSVSRRLGKPVKLLRNRSDDDNDDNC